MFKSWVNYRASLSSVARVLKRPRYALTASLFALAFFLLLRYLFGIQVLSVILTSSAVTLSEKVYFVILGFKPSSIGEFAVLFTDPVAISLILVAVLQGVAVTMLIFVRKNRPRAPKARGAASGFTLSLVGSGCIACGGSILYPLLASLGSQAAVALSSFIGLAASLAAIALILYALGGLGRQAGHILAQDR